MMNAKNIMSIIAKILLILAAALAILFVTCIAIFFLGMIIFVLLGEERYFAGYVALNGYFPIINMMFLLDYVGIFLGSLALPSAVVGAILAVVSKSKA